MSERKETVHPFIALVRLVQTCIALCAGAFVVLVGVQAMGTLLDLEYAHKWWPVPLFIGMLAVAVRLTWVFLPEMWQPTREHWTALIEWCRKK